MENMTYESAYKELKEVMDSLESESTKIDEIEIKLKRATELLEFCKSKLNDVEMNVDELLKRLDSMEDETDSLS